MAEKPIGQCANCSKWERLSDTSYTGKCDERKMVTPRDYTCDQFVDGSIADMLGEMFKGFNPLGGL